MDDETVSIHVHDITDTGVTSMTILHTLVTIPFAESVKWVGLLVSLGYWARLVVVNNFVRVSITYVTMFGIALLAMMVKESTGDIRNFVAFCIIGILGGLMILALTILIKAFLLIRRSERSH